MIEGAFSALFSAYSLQSSVSVPAQNVIGECRLTLTVEREFSSKNRRTPNAKRPTLLLRDFLRAGRPWLQQCRSLLQLYFQLCTLRARDTGQ